jgi:DNA-binding response OmpR family regulator
VGTAVIKLPDQVGILVVEDDVSIRRLIKMVLDREGYRVDSAEDGVEAVLKLGLSDYDVIVLDLMMPNLDGFTIINTLAENDPSKLKKIIITSAASPAVIRERIPDTPFDIIEKPFDINVLAARVRDCVEAQSRSG